MKLIIKLFGILAVLFGISLLIKPEIIFGWIEGNMENTSLYISAIAMRFVFGILFIVAAKESKYPGVIKFFGFLAIIVAIIFIFIGYERFQDFLSLMISDIKHYALLVGLIIIVLGGFLIYAFSRNKELEKDLN